MVPTQRCLLLLKPISHLRHLDSLVIDPNVLLEVLSKLMQLFVDHVFLLLLVIFVHIFLLLQRELDIYKLVDIVLVHVLGL